MRKINTPLPDDENKPEINKGDSPLLLDAEKITEDNEETIETGSSNKMVDLINAINATLFGKEKEQKSKINSTTARGIKRAIALNDYMDKEYSYRFKSFDALSNASLLINKSINGHAFDKAVESLKGLSTSIELNELKGLSTNDRLIGRR